MNSKQQQTAIPQEQRQPCEVWTRVMGYHRPVASFNTGKKSEYAERKFFCESNKHLSE
jgi:anaerobic ribonucleoside-triphosphate reductase